MKRKRQQERRLLFLVLPAVWLMLLVGARGQFTGALLVVGCGLSALLFAVHGFLCYLAPASDQLLLPLVGWLIGLSLSELQTLRPDLTWRQLTWVAIGFMIMIITAVFRRWSLLRERKYLLALTGAVLLLLAIVFGQGQGGSRAYLSFRGVGFQPSEFVKVILIVFLAGYLAERRLSLLAPVRRGSELLFPPLRLFGPMLVMGVVFLSLLVGQRDLGTALIYASIFLSMLFVACGRWSYMITAGMVMVLGYLAAVVIFPHVRLRIDVWLNPWEAANGSGYQLVRGLFSLAGGGLVGRSDGLDLAAQVPAVSTDLIYAAVGEHWGFLGTTALLWALCLLILRILHLAGREKDDFAALVATGVAAALASQVIVIIGGTIRLLPLTGITVPFVSYGGSSLIASFTMLGLVLAVSRGRDYGQAH